MLRFVKSCLMFLMLGTITVSTLPASIVNDVQKGEAIRQFYDWLFMTFIPWVFKATVYYVLPFMAVIAILSVFLALRFPLYGERVPLRKAFSLAREAIRIYFKSKIMPFPPSIQGKETTSLNELEE